MKNRLPFICLTLLLICILNSEVAEATPLFSYYPGMGSGDGIIYKAVDIINFDDPVEETVRSSSGWGYTIPQTAVFLSDSSCILTESNISMSYIGNHVISGEIWVRPYHGGGLLWAWGDSSGNNYLRMRLNDDCTIRIERNLLDSMYYAETSSILDTLRLNYVRWFSEVSGDTLYQTFKVNNQLVAEQKNYLESGTGFVMLRSPLQIGGIIGSGNSAKAFSGEIHAATLMNVVSQYEHTAWIPFDGSQYSGIPYYWANDHWKTYTNSPTLVNTQIFVPFLHDDFVPQGLTNSYEDPDFEGSDGMIYISLYNKDITGIIGLQKSIIAELDPGNNYKVRRCFRLRGQLQYGHNGGIAYHNGTIYIAGSGYIEGYPVPPFLGIGTQKYHDLYPLSQGLWDVSGPTSFTTYFNDTLWVGDFREADQDNPYIRGYRMNSDGSVDGNPKFYRLPLLAQGAAWTQYHNETYLFVSISSGGSNNSKLHRFNKRDLSATSVATPEKTLEFPSGSEDLSFDREGDLWGVSESGGRYYQLRSSNPWNQFFPFVYETQQAILFQDVDTTLTIDSQNERLPAAFQIKNFPNPFNNQTTIVFSIPEKSLVTICVYDIRGKEITRLIHDQYFPAGNYEYRWNMPGLSAGMYVVRLSGDHGHQTSCKILYLK